MAYTAGNLSEICQAIGGKGRVWMYITSDALSTVVGSGYISDATKKRVQVGDTVLVLSGTLNTQLSSTPTTVADGTVSEFSSDPVAAWMQVTTVSSGAATLRLMENVVDSATLTTTNTVSGAATATQNAKAAVITTEALTTTGQATWTLTLTNSRVTIGDLVLGSIGNGTNSAGVPTGTFTAGAGTLTIKVTNAAATNIQPFNGTLKISYRDFSMS